MTQQPIPPPIKAPTCQLLASIAIQVPPCLNDAELVCWSDEDFWLAADCAMFTWTKSCNSTNPAWITVG